MHAIIIIIIGVLVLLLAWALAPWKKDLAEARAERDELRAERDELRAERDELRAEIAELKRWHHRDEGPSMAHPNSPSSCR